MQRLDWVLSGGQAILRDGDVLEADIGIAGGRIAAIAAPGTLSGESAIDVEGLLVMPGVVDAHVHLGHGHDITRPRVPGDAGTESAAAAAGGVTTYLAYLISGEAYEPALFEEICAVTASASRVDFGFHFVISTEQQLQRISHYAETYGVPSFKVFMYCRGGEGAPRTARHRRRLPVPLGRNGCAIPRHALPALREHRDCQGASQPPGGGGSRR